MATFRFDLNNEYGKKLEAAAAEKIRLLNVELYIHIMVQYTDQLLRKLHHG